MTDSTELAADKASDVFCLGLWTSKAGYGYQPIWGWGDGGIDGFMDGWTKAEKPRGALGCLACGVETESPRVWKKRCRLAVAISQHDASNRVGVRWRRSSGPGASLGGRHGRVGGQQRERQRASAWERE